MIQLRPDQVQLKRDIEAAWASSAQNVLAVAPTGFGKSVLIGEITSQAAAAGLSMTIIAHRNELVSQMSGHVARRGVLHDVIAPRNVVQGIMNQHRAEFDGASFYGPRSRIRVVGVDTLLARASDLTDVVSSTDLWVTDEAHHLVQGNKWHTATEMMPRARGLGVTGSPTRADGKGLGRHSDGVMDVMVQGPTLRQLIDLGALSDYQIICAESDLKRPEVVGANGDYSPQQLKKAREKSHIVGDVVDVYIKHAYGMRTIVFATDVEGAVEIADRMRQVGIRAEAVSGKTDATIRADIVARFRIGALDVLVNVDLFDEGFDVPACECVIMARPTESLAKYLQQFGRALRAAPGKLYGLLIDMVSNVFGRHGLPDKPHRWTLDRRDKRAKRKPDPEDVGVAVCRGCSKVYDRVFKVCPYCGTPQTRDPSVRGLEQVDGDLTLVSPEMLARLRQASQLESPDAVAARVGRVAGPHAAKSALRDQMERLGAQRELADAIAWWAGLQRAKGRDDGEIYRRFYLAVGQDMMTALSGKRAEMAELTETVKQWTS